MPHWFSFQFMSCQLFVFLIYFLIQGMSEHCSFKQATVNRSLVHFCRNTTNTDSFCFRLFLSLILYPLAFFFFSYFQFHVKKLFFHTCLNHVFYSFELHQDYISWLVCMLKIFNLNNCFLQFQPILDSISASSHLHVNSVAFFIVNLLSFLLSSAESFILFLRSQHRHLQQLLQLLFSGHFQASSSSCFKTTILLWNFWNLANSSSVSFKHHH